MTHFKTTPEVLRAVAGLKQHLRGYVSEPLSEKALL